MEVSGAAHRGCSVDGVPPQARDRVDDLLNVQKEPEGANRRLSHLVRVHIPWPRPQSGF